MKMNFKFSNCYYGKVEKMARFQDNVYQETEPFPNVREAFTQENTNQPLHDENDFVEFWNKNYQNYYGDNSKREQGSCSNGMAMERKDFNELEEILNHVPRLPSYFQGIEGKKMNFIMIATTLDERTITEDLGKILNEADFQALPLSFGAETIDDISKEPSLEPATHTRKQTVPFCEQKNTRRLKRKHFELGEEQHQTFENETEMLFKPKNCKKSRMSWMSTKTTDFDEEDKDIERQIKILIQTKQL